MSSERIKLAFIGAGLAAQYHRKALLASERISLAACVAPLTPKNKLFAIESNVPIFSSLEECNERCSLDGVVIASPNQFHYQHAIDCVSMDLPFLLEKPLAATLEEATKLFDLWKEKKFKVLVGHHRAHNPIIAKAVDIVKSGRLGTVQTFVGTAQFFKPDKYFQDALWRKQSAGGPILINMIHEVDITRRLVGEISEVFCKASSAIRSFEVEDSAAIQLSFEGGALGSFMLSDAVCSPFSWEMSSGENSKYPRYKNDCYLISGTEGSLSIPSLDLYSYGNKENSWWSEMDIEPFEVFPVDPLLNQLHHFADIIEYNVDPIVSLEDGFKNLVVAHCIKQSSVLGRPIVVEY